MDEKKERSRSGGFPTVNLEEAVHLIEQGSDGGFSMSKEAFARAIGGSTANSGAFIVKLAALRDYGLIEKGGTVIYTELGKGIAKPVTEDEAVFKNKLKEAFMNCGVFNTLYQKMKEGSGESSTATIANLGMHDFRIAPVKKDAFAKNFVSSGKYAGLLEETPDGKIRIMKEPVSIPPVQSSGDHESSQSFPNLTLEQSSGIKQIYTFGDSGTGWTLTLKTSKPPTPKVKKMLVDAGAILEEEINNK